jgi:hypothetical protein
MSEYGPLPPLSFSFTMLFLLVFRMGNMVTSLPYSSHPISIFL